MHRVANVRETALAEHLVLVDGSQFLLEFGDAGVTLGKLLVLSDRHVATRSHSLMLDISIFLACTHSL
eukprot:5077996-Pleurochrysis_carterae.AAC.1